MPYRSAIEKLKSGQVLVRTRGTENASQLWQGGSLETAKGAFTGSDVLLQSCALHASNHKKRTGFGPHLRIENASQLWQGGSLETAKGAFTGGDVLLQSCALHASNHKTPTGFGPHLRIETART